MIRKSPYGLSPSIELTINGAAFDYQALNTIDLYMEENKHDMLVLGVSGISPRGITEYRNKAVYLKFSLGSNGTFFETFYGYVQDVRPKSVTAEGLVNNSPFQDVEIVCMGVSYEMRGGQTRVWDRPLLQFVSQEFAKKYGISGRVPALVSPVHQILTQEAESDWQFLVKMAKQHGMVVTMHGTSFHIFDPLKAVANNISYHKLLSSRSLIGAPQPGQITSFSGSFRDKNSDGVYRDAIVPVIMPDGQTFDVSSKEVFKRKITPRFQDRLAPVTSYSEAVRTIRARRVSTWDYEAEVTVTGMPGCRPGGVVSLEEYNAEFDGLWYVKSVHHRIASGAFLTDVCLLRNARTEIDRTGQKPRWVAPQPVIVGEQWKSSRRSINVY